MADKDANEFGRAATARNFERRHVSQNGSSEVTPGCFDLWWQQNTCRHSEVIARAFALMAAHRRVISAGGPEDRSAR